MIITLGQMLILLRIYHNYPLLSLNPQILLNLSILKVGFVVLSTIDISNWIILSCGGCPVHYRLFSSILNLLLPTI